MLNGCCSYIGDCYVAVTGIPDPRDDHAVVMAEFADECRTKTNQVLSKLTEELDQMETLGMRFGMHSGSVTGKNEISFILVLSILHL